MVFRPSLPPVNIVLLKLWAAHNCTRLRFSLIFVELITHPPRLITELRVGGFSTLRHHDQAAAGLIFKGGTPPSDVHRLIERFSEIFPWIVIIRALPATLIRERQGSAPGNERRSSENCNQQQETLAAAPSKTECIRGTGFSMRRRKH